MRARIFASSASETAVSANPKTVLRDWEMTLAPREQNLKLPSKSNLPASLFVSPNRIALL